MSSVSPTIASRCYTSAGQCNTTVHLNVLLLTEGYQYLMITVVTGSATYTQFYWPNL